MGNYTKHLLSNFKAIDDLTLITTESSSSFVDSEYERVKVRDSFTKSPFLLNFELSRKLKNRKRDKVYFCTDFVHGFPLNRKSQFFKDGKFPLAIMMHDIALLKFDYYSTRGGIINLIRKFEYKFWVKRVLEADILFVATEFTKNEFLEVFPDYPQKQIKVIPLGVDIDEQESENFVEYLPNNWKDRGYVIYMGGGIQKNKNTEGVLRGYAYYKKLLIDQNITPPYLVIAGKIFADLSIPGNRDLRELAKDLDIAQDIVYTGFYKNEHKYSLLKNAEAFIHLSIYEGFGIAVAEAMRAGVPIIADNHSTYPEVLGDNGLLVDGTDPMKVSEALFKYKQNPRFAQRKVVAAKKHSQKYDWAITAEKTQVALKELYNRKIET